MPWRLHKNMGSSLGLSHRLSLVPQAGCSFSRDSALARSALAEGSREALAEGSREALAEGSRRRLYRALQYLLFILEKNSGVTPK
jgi:hypothetical protein